MAPLTASSMPFSVSPSFMLETSIATIGVLAGFGFSFTRLVAGNKGGAFFGVDSWVGVFFVRVDCRRCGFFNERTLSSMNCCGSCRFSFWNGKLYFGVVVIGNCAFTKIHQYFCVWDVLVFKCCA